MKAIFAILLFVSGIACGVYSATSFSGTTALAGIALGVVLVVFAILLFASGGRGRGRYSSSSSSSDSGFFDFGGSGGDCSGSDSGCGGD